MSTPKISIIVPVYQVEKYLKKCVRSIQNQTYTNIQIILVDDGSTDNSPIICDKFAEEDKRIVVIHKKNGGLSDARNAGLQAALGQYIGFVDSDDYIDPRMYEILLRQLEEDEADIAICDYACVDESYSVIGNKDKVLVSNKCFLRDEFIEELLIPYGGQFVAVWNKLYKKEIFRNLQFPFGKQHEDEFVIHHIVGKCTKITCVNNQLYYYMQRQSSIMGKGFSIKSMDYGEALIDRYYFTKKMRFVDWKNHTVAQLSYKLEKWESLSHSDKILQERVDELRKKSRFLVFEKNAWKGYSVGGRCYLKFSLFAPKLAKKTRKLLKYIKDIKHYIYWCRQLKHYQTKCAYLFGTPTHTNIGDSAIVIAEVNFLKQCGYETIVEVTAREYESECKYIKRALPKKADIFLPGGGNMGSLWPIEEEWRMKIITDLLRYNRHILIFPQTLYYDDSAEAQELKKRTIKLYNSQTNLILTAREKVSYDLMKNLYPNLQVLISPDIVLSMKRTVFRNQRHGILACFRNDKEKVIPSSDEQMFIHNLRKKAFAVTEIDTMADEQITKENRWEIVRKKLEQIASARLIVTDRLHGMVFAAITETPCLVMGNNHHKVYGTYEWLKHLDYIKFVYSIHEMEKLVDEYYNKINCVFSLNSEVFSELHKSIINLHS